jgi:hypothetical protein
MEAAMGFQRRAWRTERLAWVALGLLVAAGLLGALGGGGWLSEAQAVTADGSLQIRYQRVQRLLTSSSVEVSALARPADGVVELRLGRELLEGWQIRTVLPPPAASRGEAGTLVLRFPAGDAPAPVAILEVEPERAGLRAITVGAGAGPLARLRVMVWP